jgi:hypothetical protein
LPFTVVLTFTIALVNVSAQNRTQNRPTMIPRTWDDQAMATLELPLATASASPVPVSAEYYYRIPVRPIYKTYPVYHPDQEPSGYFARLKVVEPEVLTFDFSKITAADEWIRIGEIVFDTPIDYDIAGSPAQFRDASYYTTLGIPVAHDGTVPFVRYVVREKGKVEVGVLGCGTCHTRVMPDGSIVKGAQGNFPFDRTAPPDLPEAALPVIRRLLKMLYAVPWLEERDPARPFETMTYREMLEYGRDCRRKLPIAEAWLGVSRSSAARWRGDNAPCAQPGCGVRPSASVNRSARRCHAGLPRGSVLRLCARHWATTHSMRPGRKDSA